MVERSTVFDFVLPIYTLSQELIRCIGTSSKDIYFLLIVILLRTTSKLATTCIFRLKIFAFFEQ